MSAQPVADHKRFDRQADNTLTTVGNLVLVETIRSTDTNTSSGIVGAAAGCNYQFDTRVVVGIEGDWSWTGIRTSVVEQLPAITNLSARTETFGSDMNWLATIQDASAFSPLLA